MRGYVNIHYEGTFVSQREQNIEELVQRIDQLLNVLTMISEDLREISKQIKSVTIDTPTAVNKTTEEIRALFPEELSQMITFEEEEEYIIIKPRQFLGSENFVKIASIVRDSGGEYISAGKESHFRILKKQ